MTEEIRYPNKDGVVTVATFDPATNTMQKEYHRCQKCLVRRSENETEIIWLGEPND